MFWFSNPEHSGAHKLMCYLGYRPYAIFPGPAFDTLAVYVPRAEQPVCLLLRQTSMYGWLREASPEQVEAKVSALRREGQALAEGMGCPVACLMVVYGYTRLEQRIRASMEIAHRQQVTMFFEYTGRWPGSLFWIEPTTRLTPPRLPPYPQWTHWSARVEPSWWTKELHLVAVDDNKQRKQRARLLADAALLYLKEAPARLLLQGTEILTAARETLQNLPAYLDRNAGRSYLFWIGFYMAGAWLAGCTATREADAPVMDWVRYLLQEPERWSTREQRLILRGFKWLTEKSVAHALPADAAFSQFLADLFPRILHGDFLEWARHEWRARWHLRELAQALARYGFIAPKIWREYWTRHDLQGEVLREIHEGLIAHLVHEPSAAWWQTILYTAPREEQQRVLAWYMYANDFGLAFWDWVVHQDSLLSILIEVTRISQKSAHLSAAPEALERLKAVLAQRLQTPLDSWLQRQFKAALEELTTPQTPEKTKDM